MRNCSIGIKIEGGEMVDLIQTYDLHLIESPAEVYPPVRDYEKQQYPEKSAPELDRRTVTMPFDYKISLGYWGSEKDANATIRSFMDSMFSLQGDVLVAKEVELLNNYKNVKMKGFAKKWNGKTYSVEGENALIVFDFILYVNDPNTLTDIE